MFADSIVARTIACCARARRAALLTALAGAILAATAANATAQLILQPGFDQVFLEDVDGRTRAWGLGVGDADGDMIDDVLAGDTFGDVRLLVGIGDGTFFDDGVKINMFFHDAYALAAADFNGDGALDFILPRTGGSTVIPEDGHLLFYAGNNDGTFQSSGFPQLGVMVGDAGTDAIVLAAGDVDGDMDIDLMSGDIAASDNNAADVILFRNTGNDASGVPVFTPETIISQPDQSPDPADPPYFPPLSYLTAYGLALGDVDGDMDLDLLVADRASYLYIYRNDGTGNFAPIEYGTIGTRPFAFDRLHSTFASQMALAAEDINGDGAVDILTGNTDGIWEGQVDLWLNEGNDDAGRPRFLNAGIIGGSGTDARGLAVGQLDPDFDSNTDVVFGNFEGDVFGLLTDLTDTDGDGIVDRFDNAPMHFNPPRIDMNADGGINRLDQLDNDNDGLGDPADEDDDNDGVLDDADNCVFTANATQDDFDGDGRGDACDPLNDTDSDGDGVFDGPLDPNLYDRAIAAKGRWARSDTHFIVRIDALSRVFQNEFVQTFSDAAIWSPAEWDVKKLENYNGIGDDPADPGYQVPADLPGGTETPITLVTIPRLIWDAFGDPDPVDWLNDRIVNPHLEIGQHGTYHSNLVPQGDWSDQADRNFFLCEMCGFTFPEMFQYMRIGQRTLLGDYAIDQWILQSGAVPGTSPAIDFSIAANPLISFAPPFNASDPAGRQGVARLGFTNFSASVFEENSPIFTPEGSHHEMFDQFGMFHPSADLEVAPEAPPGMSYEDYLVSITEFGGLNTFLIEEVSWSTRYCNDLPRLEPCPAAPGGVNRENNMVDLPRWENWLTLLEFVKANGEPMTQGDYSLAVSFDNAPTVANPDQADANNNGIGDVIDGATLTAEDVVIECTGEAAEGALVASLNSADGSGIADQEILFQIDLDDDGTPETFTAITDPDGQATVIVNSSLALGTVLTYFVDWDGGLVVLDDEAAATIDDTTPPTILSIEATPEMLWPPNLKMVSVDVTVEAEDICDPMLANEIVSVESSEPVEVNPGDPSPDWVITDALSVDLRAQRLGRRMERTYTITVESTDASGNAATATVVVVVPHDLRMRSESARSPQSLGH